VGLDLANDGEAVNGWLSMCALSASLTFSDSGERQLSPRSVASRLGLVIGEMRLKANLTRRRDSSGELRV
jgi:hypothetical protein